MTNYLDFEKPLAEIEGKAEELRAMARANEDMDVTEEAGALDKKAATMLQDLYKGLTPWRKCQVARHPDRPHCRDYIKALFHEYTPLAGDRNFADDQAVMGGLARFNDRPVMVIGHEKGNDTASRIRHNFGMGKPEGYRKAIRLMELAGRFGLPVVTLVDTSGAFPGVEAEGDAEQRSEECDETDEGEVDRAGQGGQVLWADHEQQQERGLAADAVGDVADGRRRGLHGPHGHDPDEQQQDGETGRPQVVGELLGRHDPPPAAQGPRRLRWWAVLATRGRFSRGHRDRFSR